MLLTTPMIIQFLGGDAVTDPSPKEAVEIIKAIANSRYTNEYTPETLYRDIKEQYDELQYNQSRIALHIDRLIKPYK
tara:strand:+ start:819 stop:1049 length:231 start_codon:yes stop_codon:yes gene_type:complete